MRVPMRIDQDPLVLDCPACHRPAGRMCDDPGVVVPTSLDIRGMPMHDARILAYLKGEPTMRVHFALIEGEDEAACADHEARYLSADASDVSCPECKDWLN